jgi:hypothetical protein
MITKRLLKIEKICEQNNVILLLISHLPSNVQLTTLDVAYVYNKKKLHIDIKSETESQIYTVQQDAAL